MEVFIEIFYVSRHFEIQMADFQENSKMYKIYVKRPIYSFCPNNSLEFIHRNTLIGPPCKVYSSVI